jgi:hypothetical protein
MRIYLSCLILFFSYSGFSQLVHEKTITIAPYKQLENYEHFKRLVMHDGDTYIAYIEGFDFEWGYTYELEVKETRIDPRLSDGTTFRYALKTIISKTPVNDSLTFRLYLSPNKYYHPSNGVSAEERSAFQQVSPRVYRYLEEVEIEIPAVLETAFIDFLGSTHSRQGQFQYLNSNRVRLVSLE